MTAALVASRELQPVTKAVRAALAPGRRRTHLSAENERGRRQILDAYTRLPATMVIAVTDYLGGDDQWARDACLRALLGTFDVYHVQSLVLDTRGVLRDRADRRTIATAIRDGDAPAGLHYTHRGSRDELLLSIPDAIGWAYGAGGRWRAVVEPLIVVTLRT